MQFLKPKPLNPQFLTERLGEFHLTLADYQRWWRDFAERHKSCVQLDEYESSDNVAPLQVVKIGGRQNKTHSVVDIVASNHGDEELPVDTARALAELAADAIEELLAKQITLVIIPLAGINDYWLNEGRRGAKTWSAYVDGYCRSADNNLEMQFLATDPPLAVRIQQAIMKQHAPATRFTLHGSLAIPPHFLASRDHRSLAKMHTALSRAHGLRTADKSEVEMDFPNVEELAAGAYSEPGRMQFGYDGRQTKLNSNGYLGEHAPHSLRIFSEAPSMRLRQSEAANRDAPKVFNVLKELFERHGHAIGDSKTSAENPLDALLVKAALRRAALYQPSDRALTLSEGPRITAQKLLLFARDVTLLTRAVRVQGNEAPFHRAQELAAEIDDWQLVEFIQPTQAVALQAGFVANAIRLEHGINLVTDSRLPERQTGFMYK